MSQHPPLGSRLARPSYQTEKFSVLEPTFVLLLKTYKNREGIERGLGDNKKVLVNFQLRYEGQPPDRVWEKV